MFRRTGAWCSCRYLCRECGGVASSLNISNSSERHLVSHSQTFLTPSPNLHQIYLNKNMAAKKQAVGIDLGTTYR